MSNRQSADFCITCAGANQQGAGLALIVAIKILGKVVVVKCKWQGHLS